MLNTYKLLLALFSLLLLGGCANPSWTAAGKIVPPVYKVCPLEGKWTVTQNLAPEGYAGEANLPAEGGTAQFTRELAVLGGYVWNKPSYKIKKVNSTDYLMTRYIALNNYLVSMNKEVDVVTLYANLNFLGEFMKIDDATVIAFVQNKALLLRKISDQADSPLPVADTNIRDTNNESNIGTSGIFIGLKIPSDNGYTYETLWVASDDKKLRPVLTRNNIFFPRNSGFWELQVRSDLKNGTAELFARDTAVKDSATQRVSRGTSLKQAQKRNTAIAIDYIGNDYIAIENITTGISILQVLPVDKLSSQIGVKVSDLLGARGLTAYRSAREQALRSLRDEGVTLLNEVADEENFGLTRKNGHWYLQGRINYQSNGMAETREFPINIIPPANLILYDTLYLSWQNIKDRVPNALDAFTSPNKDIAIIETKNKLYIYGIRDEKLDSLPMGEIEMREGETVIMAEWATGSYVDIWERAFLSNDAQVGENAL
ncbi:hypothetical protein Psfp_00988 [Pelotomaculum sp. FP]|uniref:hypothetical protein n=1 Tax=Pelotomaculum sp. FP TaxID=261474 RepID=UPI001064FC9D|nr:hypothetical protein [Pelotomaculum sp. FP]TEB16825.1 hypothetical protein Psfp_00988 [Pelotomaculum sp. FP]